MAQHIIRDSKGRVEKILDDKEYAEYQKHGCCGTLIIGAIIGIIILFNVNDCEGDKAGSAISGQKREVVDKGTSSHSGTVTTNNTIDETPPTIEEPTAEPTPEEYEVPAEQAIESEPSVDEPKRKLSRKERRALRRAQKASTRSASNSTSSPSAASPRPSAPSSDRRDISNRLTLKTRRHTKQRAFFVNLGMINNP